MLDRDKLIAAIVESTGTKLSHDDPAFVLVALNQLCLEQSVAVLLAKVNPVAQNLKALTHEAGKQLVNGAVQEFAGVCEEERRRIEVAGNAARDKAVIAMDLYLREHAAAARLKWGALAACAALVLVGSGFTAGYLVAPGRTAAESSAVVSTKDTRDRPRSATSGVNHDH